MTSFLLDVLEHLSEPSETLRKLTTHLERNGHVIVSIPNFAHWSVSIPLLFKRRFDYKDAGILDRTHLRFFVEDTAIKLLNDANLMVQIGMVPLGPKSKILDALSFGALRHYLAMQYSMAGQLCEGKISQKRSNG